jgi:hypothetical protein
MKQKIAAGYNRLQDSMKEVIPKALKTAWWMLKIMLPVSLAVRLMQYFGIIDYIAQFFSPVFQHLGLPGESALVFITSVLLSIYACIAVLGTLAFDNREMIIIAIMCLISHNMIVETAVQKKTGSSALRMVILRLTASFVAAYLLNLLLPQGSIVQALSKSHAIQYNSVSSVFMAWLTASFWLSAKIILIVTGLMFLQKILEYYGVMKVLSVAMVPVIKPMGLSEKTSFQWIVANIVGLTYGSAIMFEQVESGNLPLKDADMLNNHIAISHSLLEDTLLFVAIGVPALWITIPRLVLAIGAVWLYRFELAVFKK